MSFSQQSFPTFIVFFGSNFKVSLATSSFFLRLEALGAFAKKGLGVVRGLLSVTWRVNILFANMCGMDVGESPCYCGEHPAVQRELP